MSNVIDIAHTDDSSRTGYKFLDDSQAPEVLSREEFVETER
jgi:hypothetical protein